MKVDENHNPTGKPLHVKRGAAAASGKSCPDCHTPVADSVGRVHLSPRARSFAEARRQLDALPEIDSAKVREIKRRLQSGRYRLDAEKIAESMIRDVLNHQE